MSSTACSPTLRSSRPTPTSAPRSRRPSASATRSSSTRSARSSGGRSARTSRPWPATRRGRSSASRSPLAVKTAGPIVALSAHFNEATDENVEADLAALGGLLDRVDELIAAGTINGPELNAADFQIAPEPEAGDDAAGPAPADRGTSGGRAGQAGRPEDPGRTSRRSCRRPGWSRSKPKAGRRARRARRRRAPPARRPDRSRREREVRVELEQRARGRSAGSSPRGAAASAARW